MSNSQRVEPSLMFYCPDCTNALYAPTSAAKDQLIGTHMECDCNSNGQVRLKMNEVNRVYEVEVVRETWTRRV